MRPNLRLKCAQICGCAPYNRYSFIYGSFSLARILLAMPSSALVVRYKNEINRAAHSLDIVECRIIFTAIAQIPRDREISADDVYWISASDLVALGSNSSSVYQQMKMATENLFDRYITLPRDSEASTKKRRQKFRWIQAIEYEEGSGRIGIQFSSRIIPFISHIKDEFTRYELTELEGFQSYYTVRLYSMLAQFKSTKKFAISVADLRASLELEDKYPLYNNFKRKVILPSLQKINESERAAFTVTFQEKKLGRRVDKLIFFLKMKPEENVIDVDADEDDLLSPEQIKLSKKQIGMYADFLSGRSEKYEHVTQAFYADCRKRGLLNWFGKEKEECAADLRKKLADPEFAAQIYDWLKKVGFGG